MILRKSCARPQLRIDACNRSCYRKCYTYRRIDKPYARLVEHRIGWHVYVGDRKM